MHAPAPEITADELARDIERGALAQLLDVRLTERVEAGRIEGVATFRNMPVRALLGARDLAPLGFDAARPVAVVCDQGLSSRGAASFLRERGFDAVSIAGGMAAWMNVLVPRPLLGLAGVDAVVQFDRPGKGALGYLVARGGEALAVDPPRRFDPYLGAAREIGARIVAVADTHCHADYLSGGPALAAAAGAPYFLHPADAVDPFSGERARIAFTPLAAGGRIEVGGAVFTVHETPGHTEGSVSLLLAGELGLTGDFLFVASVGRPDIAGRATEWTEALFASLERARRDWPAVLRVLPGHYAAESERSAARTIEAPMGDLLRHNVPLGIVDPQDFRAWVRERTGPTPAAYKAIKAANLGLLPVDDAFAEAVEGGRNQCALAR